MGGGGAERETNLDEERWEQVLNLCLLATLVRVIWETQFCS